MVCSDVDSLVQNINMDKHIRFTGDICLWVNDWPRVTDPVPSRLFLMVNGKCRQASMKCHTHQRPPNDTPSAPNTPNNTNYIDEDVEHVNKMSQMSSNGNKIIRGAGNHLEPTTAASRESHSFLSYQHAGAWSKMIDFCGRHLKYVALWCICKFIRFHYDVFLMCIWRYVKYRFRPSLGALRRQAITWVITEWDAWRRIELLGHSMSVTQKGTHE